MISTWAHTHIHVHIHMHTNLINIKLFKSSRYYPCVTPSHMLTKFNAKNSDIVQILLLSVRWSENRMPIAPITQTILGFKDHWLHRSAYWYKIQIDISLLLGIQQLILCPIPLPGTIFHCDFMCQPQASALPGLFVLHLRLNAVLCCMWGSLPSKLFRKSGRNDSVSYIGI